MHYRFLLRLIIGKLTGNEMQIISGAVVVDVRRLQNDIRKRLPETESLEPSSKDGQRWRSFYVQWQSKRLLIRSFKTTANTNVMQYDAL
jgi:hypothetical protein